MSNKKQTKPANTKSEKTTPAPAPRAAAPVKKAPENLFGRENYIWIIGGLIVMIIGLFLMSGGKSPDPDVFKNSEVYSFRRITLAPILILAGLGMEVFAIFRKPKEDNTLK